MKKALIIFGSTTGNTEELAEMIRKTLESSGVSTEIKNVIDVDVEELKTKREITLLGCPAYGDDSIELQEDFEDFYDQMNGIKLEGGRFAVFAPGDSSYEYFCGSVDLLEKRIEEMGGKIIQDGLKIDGDPGGSEDEIIEWASSIVDALN